VLFALTLVASAVVLGFVLGRLRDRTRPLWVRMLSPLVAASVGVWSLTDFYFQNVNMRPSRCRRRSPSRRDAGHRRHHMDDHRRRQQVRVGPRCGCQRLRATAHTWVAVPHVKMPARSGFALIHTHV